MKPETILFIIVMIALIAFYFGKKVGRSDGYAEGYKQGMWDAANKINYLHTWLLRSAPQAANVLYMVYKRLIKYQHITDPDDIRKKLFDLGDMSYTKLDNDEKELL